MKADNSKMKIVHDCMKGCIPSPVDTRDYTPAMAKSKLSIKSGNAELPEEYISEGNVKILDQGEYPTCVAHALASTMAMCECKKGAKKPNDFSRGFIYANRKDDQFQEEGMIVREALKQLNHDGDCLYGAFPYNGYYQPLRKKLEDSEEELLEEAAPYTIASYFRCNDAEEVKQAIYDYGAALIAIPTFTDFGENTYVKLPNPQDSINGYHAMCCVGWTKTHWIVQNSWGKGFGEKGICYIPFEYPVEEWWGVIINESAPDYELPNIFTRIWRKIEWFFKRLFKIK